MASYAFVGTAKSPAMIRKLDLNTLVLESSISCFPYRNLQTAAVDEVGGFGYFSVNRGSGSDNRVIKVDLATFSIVGDIQYSTSYSTPGTVMFLDVPHNYGYVSDYGSSLHRFTLSPFAYTDHLDFLGTLHTGSIDIANQLAYVCPYTSFLPPVYRINLSTFTTIDNIVLPAGEGYPWRSIIDSTYLYVLTAEASKVVRIMLSTFLRVDSFAADEYGSFVMGDAPYAFIGGYGKIYRVNLDTMSTVDNISGDAGAHYAGCRNSNTAIFVNNSTAPPQAEIVDIPSFTLTGIIPLVLGDLYQYGDGAIAIGASTSTPTIDLSVASLSPSCFVGEDATSQTFDVSNSGAGTLNYTISDNETWLTCTPSSGTCTAETDTITVNYSTASLDVGTYTATITVEDSGASNTPQTISVSLNVTVPSIGMTMRHLKWFYNRPRSSYLGWRV